jgi:hypothetical protein
MSFERIPRVAIVGDGLSSDDLSWLSLHGALNVVVLENQERPEDVFNASPDVLQQAWETVRLVLEYGAAAVELDAIVRRIRERRGRKVLIEVSKPPVLYQLPTVDLGKRGDEGGAVGSDDPADGYFDEVRRALGGIDADRPDEAPSQSRAALQFGFPRRWFDWEERWDVPSFSIGRSVAELRAAAEAGDVEAARELLGSWTPVQPTRRSVNAGCAGWSSVIPTTSRALRWPKRSSAIPNRIPSSSRAPLRRCVNYNTDR